MNISTLDQFQDALAWFDDLVRLATQHAIEAGGDPTDSLRGLIITADEVDRHLARTPMMAAWTADGVNALVPSFLNDAAHPIAHLAAQFGLNALDCAILLMCLAPELDRRYERLYAFIQDDVSQRRPTVNLAMNLLGGGVSERFAVWERLAAHQPLRAHHLIETVQDPAQHHATFIAHQLKLDHRVLSHLLGDRTPDMRLKHAVTGGTLDTMNGQIAELPLPIRQALPDAPLVFLQGAKGVGRREAAVLACAEHDLPLVIADLATLQALEMPFPLAWKLALREARLADAALLLYDWNAIVNAETQQPPLDLWNAIVDYPRAVFLCGSEAWESLDPDRTRVMLRAKFTLPLYDRRRVLWDETLYQRGLLGDGATNPAAIDEVAAKFKLTGSQIRRAVNTAIDLAASRGEDVASPDLIYGAQAHSSIQLGRLAKRVEPRYTWDDLVLPPDRIVQLREIVARVRYVHVVNDNWGFARRVAAAPGITVLFAGESGTGKTLSAEIIAKDLGLLLYKIDLSSVVSKYIGETEKNLSVIFEQAHASNAVLFFDEADALFGKRSEVKDAHDRYANLEVAFLLQQLESYEGVAILATNLRQNLDEAFTRRLSFMIDFPFPESESREHLWQTHLPAEAPIGRDVNLREIAERFPLAGGNIRNAAIASAYLAAADGGVITMTHIRHAIRREHQKMGRLLDDQD